MTIDKPQPARNFRRAIVLLAVAIGIGYLLIRTGPTTSPEEEKHPPTTVRTVQVQPGTHKISLQAYGTVIPSRKIVIEPEVTGQIVQQHPALVPGGILKKGEELLFIDPTLIKLSLLESKASLARVQTTLREEERKRNETRQLRQDNLISQTELAAQEAAVQIQEAELSRLEAGLARTEELLRRHTITAPFNALVIEESVEIGQRVDAGFAAATLAGIDTYWVEASLPVDQLRWIALPQGSTPGAEAGVFLENSDATSSTRYAGRVTRLKGDIQPDGRMARIIISIDKPLDAAGGSSRQPLLLGSYVRVEIDAGELTQTYKVDRAALRDGDRVWIMDENSRLQIRDVQVRWRKNEEVFIGRGLNPGDILIVSPLRIALPGMELAPQKLNPEPPAGKQSRVPNTEGAPDGRQRSVYSASSVVNPPPGLRLCCSGLPSTGRAEPGPGKIL